MKSAVQKDVSALSRIEAVMMILKTLNDMTGLRYSLVARLTEDTWTACAILDNMNFGLQPGDELVLQSTYCNTIREQHAPVLVRHASREPEFQDHPALKTYAVESYIGVPLYRRNGEYFGVLCALDLEPHDISEKHIQTFQLMAKLIAHELEAEEQRIELEESLKLAHRTNEARARFMSILGHDLRSPLSTITSAARLLKNNSENTPQMADRILRTSERMRFLVEDLLDAAQTARGNQILIQRKSGNLYDILKPVIEDFQLAKPDRLIEFFGVEDCPGEWDEGRLGQVLSNLLSNAQSYGNPQFSISVVLVNDANRVILQVNNKGETMSEEVRQNLFTPFWRGAIKTGETANSSGLGLGLYIVKQIVEAHDGAISVESNDENGTTFSVSLPFKAEPGT